MIGVFLSAVISAAQSGPIPVPETIDSASIRQVKPLSIWTTLAGGKYSRAVGGGVTVQMALANGLTAGVDASIAEEYWGFSLQRPEKFRAGSLLFGYRLIELPAIFSFAAGPSWGWGQHRKPGAEPTPIPDCDWFCSFTFLEMVQDKGWGFRIQANVAFTNRVIGIGGQFHYVYLPDYPYVGGALIVPIGRFR